MSNGGVGHRGIFDGNKNQQFTGMLAETMVCDYLGALRPANEGFDGGFDLIWNDKKYDVKCEIRKGWFKPMQYVHNLVGSQLGYQAEGFIFVNHSWKEDGFELCGFIDKKDFIQHAFHYEQGSRRQRTDGSMMEVNAPGGLYEITQKWLQRFE